MCGIAGVLHSGQADDDGIRPVLDRMQRSLQHRGPDGSGQWVSPCGQAAFVHTRLAIIDLSSAGLQPMQSPDGRCCIVFNGEIYNYQALREALASSGVIFTSHTDTEVILHLYLQKGTAFLKELRGMFAFAIWDARDQSCLLVRDGLGIKPLYYSQQGTSLIFASELRTILSSDLVSRRIDPTGLARYLQSGSVPEPWSLVKGVNQLEAGTALLWKNDAVSLHRWWELDFPSSSEAEIADPVAFTRRALMDSLDHHFVSDVPVGLFLSGGIDSTALLALCHASGRRQLRTFCVGVDHAGSDESSLAAQTASLFSSQHQELKLNSSTGLERFQQYLNAIDQPSVDGFNTYCVAGFARDQGMKVVLSGLGGDELFAGYPSFQKLPTLLRSMQLLSFSATLRRVVGSGLEKWSAHPGLRRLGSALAAGDSTPGLATAYGAFRGIYSLGDSLRLTQSITGTTVWGNSEIGPLSTPSDLQAAIGVLETSLYMRNQLLKDSDVMSMVHGLELRVPMVDTEFYRQLSLIPASVRLQKGKKLLLQAVPEIPTWVSQRSKTGFQFPFEKWLQDEGWNDEFGAIRTHLPDSHTPWYQKWTLFVLVSWCQRHGVVLGS